jgi:hypothetical protein
MFGAELIAFAKEISSTMHIPYYGLSLRYVCGNPKYKFFKNMLNLND